jgi:hypothetical protein
MRSSGHIEDLFDKTRSSLLVLILLQGKHLLLRDALRTDRCSHTATSDHGVDHSLLAAPGSSLRWARRGAMQSYEL